MRVSIPAPAKVNLYLRITAVRADGMHELDTAFAFTDLCDRLHLSPADDIQVGCSRPELAGKHNLVHRVLTAFRQKHGVQQGMRVHIDKHIPEQAGLGGGSSDAASALLAANRLWAVHAPVAELICFATAFGADIPCFLYGRASRASGIGEQLQDYAGPLPDSVLLLAKPQTGLSTAAVFHHFDSALTDPEGLDTIRRDSPSLAENSMEASACQLNPDVAALLLALRRYTDTAWMSGSGSACVALFDSLAEAQAVADMLQRQQLAGWTYIGKLCSGHPLDIEQDLNNEYWDVAKR